VCLCAFLLPSSISFSLWMSLELGETLNCESRRHVDVSGQLDCSGTNKTRNGDNGGWFSKSGVEKFNVAFAAKKITVFFSRVRSGLNVDFCGLRTIKMACE